MPGISVSSTANIVPVCALGASAGGLAPLREFFRRIPDDLGFAYVVIIHLAPDHPSVLDEILAKSSTMPVTQVRDAAALEPNKVYVIPPNKELFIDGNNVTARDFQEARGARAPIDMFFQSVSEARGDGCAVILSGAGSDGAIGAQKIRAAGGVVFVQEPKDAEYAVMPRSAIASGAADFVAPIPKLVERLVEVARSKKALQALEDNDAERTLHRILSFLHSRTGHDFSNYKRATVMRRVMRRMQVARSQSLAAYSDYLVSNPEEAQELFADLLISVTSFFRDPAAYEALAEQVIPSIFKEAGEEGIRAWIAGCATGEEAYSLAILMLEEAERRGVSIPIQIFATDLDEGALATAREARYPAAIEVDVSEDRLQRFFVREGVHYRIRKEVRDLVLIASHSVLKDPPFMRLDLISCRNLLIYLERDLQRDLCTMYAYALKPHGFLFLGSAETTDAAPDTFTALDRDSRIFRVRPQGLRHKPFLAKFPPERRMSAVVPPRRPEPEERDRRLSAVHLSALESAAPPSALVDRDFRIIHLSQHAGRFLMPAGGVITLDIASMVRQELRLDLTTALRRAIEQAETTLSAPIAVGFNGSRRRVMLQVSPVQENGGPPSHALVLFIDAGALQTSHEEAEHEDGTSDTRRLRDELSVAEARLSASRVEYEAALQDLRVANEELQSINEEYRSTSEELETSKEELQSMNEELQTVNAELKSKLESISTAHSDLENLVSSTDVGTLFLDPRLRIRMFTPDVARVFNITEADVGRAITDFTHRLSYQALAADAERVLRDLSPVEQEIETQDGRWLLVRIRPYRTIDARIDGAVVTFIDVSERRAAVASMRASDERFRALVKATSNAVYCMSPDWKEMRLLRGGDTLADSTEPNPDWLTSFVHEDDRTRVWTTIEEAIKAKKAFEVEHRVRRANGAVGWTLLRAVPIIDSEGGVQEWFGSATDVTERRRGEEARSLLIGELNHRVKNMLAVVQSIAAQTRRSSSTMDEFGNAFESRIHALAGAHNLLTRSQWTGIQIRELARSVLASFLQEGDDRISLSGPDVNLKPDVCISVAMALHELGTNAVKYGALSCESGRIDIVWSVERKAVGEWINLKWTERGGPPVKPPERDGFGSRLLKKGLARELDGDVRLEFDKSGLRCVLEFPVDEG